MMQTNFKKQDDNILRDLIRDHERTANQIADLISERDSVNSEIAELREELQELNDGIESTKDENEKSAKKQEDEFTEILNSGNYSDLAREFRRLNREIYEGRMRGWYTFIENTSYPSQGEVRQQRRDIVDKLLIVEEMEYENRK